MKLLIATKNPGKEKELKKILGAHFEIISLRDFARAPDVEETGATFEENSLLKAKAYFAWSKIPSIADDGGLEIDALQSEPGVKSRRWPGYEATDQQIIDIALEKLHGVPWEKRTAHLRTVGTYYDGKNILTASGSIDGFIVEEEPSHCEAGYPFRSIFWIPQLKKVYRDLTHEEHEQINHRKFAYEKLAGMILQLAD